MRFTIPYLETGSTALMVLPPNPPDLPAKHVEQLLEQCRASKKSGEPVDCGRGSIVDEEKPSPQSISIAASLMNVLSIRVDERGLPPSWRGWDIAMPEEGRVETTPASGNARAAMLDQDLEQDGLDALRVVVSNCLHWPCRP